MPNIKCNCGELITLGTIPSNSKFHLFPDTEVESLANLMMKKSEEKIFDFFYSVSIEVAMCPNCKRIWIDFENNGLFIPYNKEG